MRGPTPSLPRTNARNHKTRNPGFKPSGHWVLCDRCGCSVRADKARLTWEGFVVCPDDWEPRHSQDFVRAKFDRIAPEGLVRPDNGDGAIFIQSFCSTNSSINGVAISGCAIAGNTKRQAYTSEIPTGTF